ncbi:hypothetical protein C2845_PM01G29460 [Panicum miliaceum]|uniref:Uncharacterized protein n=1 Tax=Panicum miliaceum TaxID=4540 RepID=A0A3L6TF13_PANMI|nr:hypothetical protein C2845_PM01G29460 [Panicum miliaceum]
MIKMRNRMAVASQSSLALQPSQVKFQKRWPAPARGNVYIYAQNSLPPWTPAGQELDGQDVRVQLERPGSASRNELATMTSARSFASLFWVTSWKTAGWPPGALALFHERRGIPGAN